MRESATRPANMNSYLKKSRLCMTLVIEVMNVGSSVQPDSLLKVVSIFLTRQSIRDSSTNEVAVLSTTSRATSSNRIIRLLVVSVGHLPGY